MTSLLRRPARGLGAGVLVGGEAADPAVPALAEALDVAAAAR